MQLSKTIGGARIHFNGDYFLDDGNNFFLQRHPTTHNWFIMIRPGYENGFDVVDTNNRIEKSIGLNYGFYAAWQEYNILLDSRKYR